MVKIKLNKSELSLIECLIKIKVIKYLKKLENNKYLIYINYHKEKPLFENIKNVHKPSSNVFLKIKNIEEITKKSNSIILLSTNRGIITNFEAIRYHTGGIIIMNLWN